MILLQTPRAARYTELEKVATSCREETEAAKWLRTRVKEATPQVFATG